MAANSKSRGITSFGKRVINQIWTANSPSPTHSFSPSAPALTFRRAAAYSSSYEKNPDEQILSSAVPDNVIEAAQSGKYWAPHPQTGVFGPPTEHVNTPVAGGERGFLSGSAGTATNAGGGASSVLEEKAWFRLTSIEDLEKPHSLP